MPVKRQKSVQDDTAESQTTSRYRCANLCNSAQNAGPYQSGSKRVAQGKYSMLNSCRNPRKSQRGAQNNAPSTSINGRSAGLHMYSANVTAVSQQRLPEGTGRRNVSSECINGAGANVSAVTQQRLPEGTGRRNVSSECINGAGANVSTVTQQRLPEGTGRRNVSSECINGAGANITAATQQMLPEGTGRRNVSSECINGAGANISTVTQQRLPEGTGRRNFSGDCINGAYDQFTCNSAPTASGFTNSHTPLTTDASVGHLPTCSIAPTASGFTNSHTPRTTDASVGHLPTCSIAPTASGFTNSHTPRTTDASVGHLPTCSIAPTASGVTNSHTPLTTDASVGHLPTCSIAPTASGVTNSHTPLTTDASVGHLPTCSIAPTASGFTNSHTPRTTDASVGHLPTCSIAPTASGFTNSHTPLTTDASVGHLPTCSIAPTASGVTNSHTPRTTDNTPYSSLESDTLSLEECPMDAADSEKANVHAGTEVAKDIKNAEKTDNSAMYPDSEHWHSTPNSKTDQSDIFQNDTKESCQGWAYSSCDERYDSERHLSSTGLEIDVILVQEQSQTHLSSAPAGIATDYEDSKPRVPGYENPVRALFSAKKSCQSDVLYITHAYKTDSDLGDRFGAKCDTYEEAEYNRHILRDIEPGSPADKMKILNDDEIVLFNDEFAPKLSHTDILNLFHHVPVDGKTKFDLVIRRKVKGCKSWQWYESSAILAPDTRYVPRVERPTFVEVKDNVKTYTQFKKYRIKNSPQLFLGLQASGVTVSPIRHDSSDRAKIITKKTTIWQNPDDGGYTYYCTLCGFDCSSYVAIDQETKTVKIQTEEPKPFQWKEVAGDIYFLFNGMYLSYAHGKVTVSKCQYFFEESPGHPGADHCDLGQYASSQDSIDSGYSTPNHPQNPQHCQPAQVDHCSLVDHQPQVDQQPQVERSNRMTSVKRQLMFRRTSTVGLSDPLSNLNV